MGAAVAEGGDFNSDGVDDAIVGAPGADVQTDLDAGEALVLLGHRHDATRKAWGQRTVHVQGGEAGDRLGKSVASAGDFNGDAYEDVIVGAPGADPYDRDLAGAAYVLYGSKQPQSDRLDENVEGVAIYGAASGDRIGASVAGAGDFNGDGLDDVIVGAPEADPVGRDDAGTAFVVYGRRGAGAIDLASDLKDVAILNGATAASHAGRAVAGVHDVNGDALDDVIIGAPGYDANGGFAGAGYVVWGMPSGARLDLGLVGGPLDIGFVMLGGSAGDDAGWSVSSAGDANADGRPDVAIGARGVDVGGLRNVGAAYVVLRQQGESVIQLRELGNRGYAIVGSHTFDLTAAAVAWAGDANGDGLDDLVVGAPRASRSEPNQGIVCVIPGRRSSETVYAGSGSLHWFAGDRRYARFGTSVAGIGDFDANGSPDLLIGAPRSLIATHRNAGEARLIMLE